MNLAKENLSIYLPSLIELLRGIDLDWARIDELFSNKIEERKIELSTRESILIEATIYDIIIKAKQYNLQALRYLYFQNSLFYELSINLSELEKKLVRENIRNYLTRLDKRYVDYLGEIAVLNHLLKSKNYKLEATEVKLENNKSIDFKLRILKNNSYILLEVYNIHLEHDRIDSNEEKIKAFLTKRLTEKINNKKSMSTEDTFMLIPVLWGEAEDIKIYSEYFKKNKIDIANTSEPVAYVGYTSESVSQPRHFFGTVSGLFPPPM